MEMSDVRRAAFAMPLTNPSYPPGPYRFRDREYLITYRIDPDALAAMVPKPLEIGKPPADGGRRPRSVSRGSRLVHGNQAADLKL
jgi:acetoacetate decarboxylase